MAKGVVLGVGQRARNEVEGEVKISKGEEGEHERDELIDEFDVEKGFAQNGVISKPDLLEME